MPTVLSQRHGLRKAFKRPRRVLCPQSASSDLSVFGPWDSRSVTAQMTSEDSGPDVLVKRVLSPISIFCFEASLLLRCLEL